MRKGFGLQNPVLGHRGFWHECRFWFRSTYGGSVPNDKLAYDKAPDGIFWADEAGDMIVSDNAVSSAMFDSHNVNIKTRDDVHVLRPKDMVWYDGHFWIINSIRLHKIRQFHQVCDRFDLCEYTISLSR